MLPRFLSSIGFRENRALRFAGESGEFKINISEETTKKLAEQAEGNMHVADADCCQPHRADHRKPPVAVLFGIMTAGILKYASRFFTIKSPIDFFVGILELISEVAKIISFSFRLFGNVFAGEVLLTIIVFLLPYAVPLPFLFLEVFVGFIQAFVFTMLTIVFISISTAENH